MVLLKYLSNFWRTLEILLIYREVNLILTCSANCVIIYANVTNQNPTFEMTETKLYVPVVTLSTQDNAKLLRQLKLGFKRTINLNHLVEASFGGINILFVLAFENDAQRTSNKRYYVPNVEIKDAIIDGKNAFDQPVKNNKKIWKIRKIAIGQGDDYRTGYLLDYPYFKESYKMVAIDLSKQQALDADPKAIQQINFTVNLDRGGI